MKKYIALLSALMIVLACVPALAGTQWYCPSCGRLNDNNFCPWDGTPRPSGMSGGSVTITGGSLKTAPSYTGFGYSAVTLNQKLASRTGPGTIYDEPGTFLSSGTKVTALSRAYDERNEIWWIQVRFSVKGTVYQVYTGAKRFSDLRLADLPQEDVIGYCYVNKAVYGYYGPGPEYALIARNVPAGVSCDVYARDMGADGDYIQIEFYDVGQQKTRRAWVLESQVTNLTIY